MHTHVHSECTTSNNRLFCHSPLRYKTRAVLLLSSQGTSGEKGCLKFPFPPLSLLHFIEIPVFLSCRLPLDLYLPQGLCASDLKDL